MSKSKSTQHLLTADVTPNKSYLMHQQPSSEHNQAPMHKNSNIQPLQNINSYPKFTSRYKTYYMKEYKQKKRINNVCYNPNTRVHTKQQYNIDGLTTNNVHSCPAIHEQQQ